MARVFIPVLLRELTGGEAEAVVAGATVRELIATLEDRYPGIADRLTGDGRLRPNLAVAIDGEVMPLGLRAPVEPSSEVHFVAAIKGG
ncbi:MAG: MoaD/ThiS family protein [Bryobacteraceae bacterium]